MSEVLTPKQLKTSSGLLLIIGTLIVAIGLGYLLGAGVGWVVFGLLILLWSRQLYKSLPKDEQK